MVDMLSVMVGLLWIEKNLEFGHRHLRLMFAHVPSIESDREIILFK
jgi:hypothetical protein